MDLRLIARVYVYRGNNCLRGELDHYICSGELMNVIFLMRAISDILGSGLAGLILSENV